MDVTHRSDTSPGATWKQHYQVALFEDDGNKLPSLMRTAEKELIARTNELREILHQREMATEYLAEQREIENAKYFLGILAKSIANSLSPAS